MAKDPAFLFYYQDFLVGVDHMTDEQIGEPVGRMTQIAEARIKERLGETVRGMIEEVFE